MLATDFDLAKQQLSAGTRARSGSRVLSALAVLSFTVCSWLLSTTAGGLWLFYRRFRDQPAYLDPRVLDGTAYAPTPVSDALFYYVLYALIASVLVISPIVVLTANAAVMGASGREEKMAVFRLLGASSRRTTRLALMMTVGQAAVGLVLGFILSFISAPMWSALDFQYTQVRVWEMYLPWWGYLLLAIVFMAVVLAAGMWGLRRVIISPLGVARKEPAKKLSWVRAAAFVISLLVAVLLVDRIGNQAGGILVMSVVLILVLAGINLVMVWVLQNIARGIARITPSVAMHTAMRRIQTNPKQAWKRVGVLAFLAFILGWIAGLMLEAIEDAESFEPLYGDIFIGVYLVVAFGMLTAAISTLLTQSSEVFENRERNLMMENMGAPRNFSLKVSFWEILSPLVISTGITWTLGCALGQLMLMVDVSASEFLANAAPKLLILFTGYALVLIALVLSHRLRRMVVRDSGRRRQTE